MAFDNTQPTDTTKIRNLGTVIRPNWVAIEEAASSFKPYAINLNNRTPLGVSNDPTAIADSNILYSKDSGSYAEIFSINENSDIVQLTAAGYMGGATTNARVNNIRFGSGSVDYDENNIGTAYISWNSSGTALASHRASIVRNSTGNYTVTLTDARSSTNYVPIVSANYTALVTAEPKIQITSTTTFNIIMVNAGGSGEDEGGFCVVFGGW